MPSKSAVRRLRQAAMRSELVTGAVRDMRRAQRAMRRRRTADAIGDYLRAHSPTKLQVGAGLTQLDGWLATDLHPRAAGTLQLDATRPFPIAEASFDYLASEHMIEHITWLEGQQFLRESYRVLKPGGRIRLATPDLRVLVELYRGGGGDLGGEYVGWVTDNYIPAESAHHPSLVLNHLFHGFGHRFLYDFQLLELALRRAGFADIERMQIGESADSELRGVEQHGLQGDSVEMNNFETIVVEARKP